MSIISRLGVILGLDAGEFNAGLTQAEGSLNKFSGVAKGIGVAAVAAIGYELVKTAGQAVQFADSINDVAKANEMSVSKVLEFSNALSVSGGKAEDAAKVFASFTNKIDEAANGSQDMRDKFAKLGITLKDLETLDQQQLFDKTMMALGKMPDQISRNALAMDIFGKSMKGVDIVGMNEEFQRLNGTMTASDDKFAKIGDAMDDLDRLSAKIKTDMANNIAEPVLLTTKILNKLYDDMSRGNGILEEQSKKLEKYGLSWKNVFLGGAMQTVNMGMAMVGAAKGKKEDTSHYTPQNAWYDANPVVPSILKSEEQLKLRNIALTKEQIAANEKLKKEYESQSQSLKQQIASMGLEKEALHGELTIAEKLSLEFAEGGKYHRLANTELAKKAIAQAKDLEQEKQKVALQKEAAQWAIRKNEMEMAEREARAQEAAQWAIRKNQHDMDFQKRIEDMNMQKERLELDRASAGMADTQREKLLAIYDLEAQIVKMKRDDKQITEEQVEAYRKAGMAVIEADEANKRAQKTFQAGWNRAYENFKEKAMDSAALGAEAFNSMTSNMERALDNFVTTGKLSFKDLIGSMIQDLIRLYMKAQVTGFFKMFMGGGDGGSMGSAIGESLGMTGFGGWLSGLFFADGGDPPVGKASVVGENGPELFVPKTAGTIVPNNHLSASIGNGGPQINYNGPYIANMNAIDTQSAAQFLAKNKDSVWASYQSAQRSLPMSRA